MQSARSPPNLPQRRQVVVLAAHARVRSSPAKRDVERAAGVVEAPGAGVEAGELVVDERVVGPVGQARARRSPPRGRSRRRRRRAGRRSSARRATAAARRRACRRARAPRVPGSAATAWRRVPTSTSTQVPAGASTSSPSTVKWRGRRARGRAPRGRRPRRSSSRRGARSARRRPRRPPTARCRSRSRRARGAAAARSAHRRGCGSTSVRWASRNRRRARTLCAGAARPRGRRRPPARRAPR